LICQGTLVHLIQMRCEELHHKLCWCDN